MRSDEIQQVLGETGAFSSRMPGFEFRPQQLEMAEAVARSLEGGEHLIVEAGTGTGKSLAYLVPALLWAVRNNKKVIISTYTKILQHQILNHDIPFLSRHLGVPFRYALCLGHENYLSLRRLGRAAQAGLFTNPGHDDQLTALFDWAETTDTGLRSDLPFEVSPAVWEEVGRQKDQCMGKQCPTYSSCFYFKERKRWFGAHLLVVNHHLFFANMASEGAVLPRFDAVIFDEAQNLEEAATSFLGFEISNSGLSYFLDRLHHPKTRKGLLARYRQDATEPVRTQVNRVRQAGDTFFTRIFEDFGRRDRVLRFYKPPVWDNSIYVPLQELYERLKTLEGTLGSEEDRLDIAAAAQRCFEINNTLTAFLNHQLDGYVYWLELVEKKRHSRAVLRGVPVDISEPLREQVFDKMDRVVMTSATLTTHRGFEFIKGRLGFDPDREQELDSPFDYPSQALFYVPGDLPEPGEEVTKYVDALAIRCRELVQASEGKAFLLFTSYAVLNQVYDRLEDLNRDYPLLKQDGGSTPRMIRRFKEKPSVIFGTTSFWQGVDIPGEALSHVIITKLPFDVPRDPLTEARLEALRKKSVDPFVHYQLPRAIIQLKQGVGRLIRKKTDRGVVSILDSRVVNRGYGRQFLASLPACRVVDDLDAVRQFLQMGHGLEVPKS